MKKNLFACLEDGESYGLVETSLDEVGITNLWQEYCRINSELILIDDFIEFVVKKKDKEAKRVFYTEIYN